MAFPNIFMDIEEDDEENDLLSLVRLVETLIETRLFRQSLDDSMETYSNELFRRQDELRLNSDPIPWTDQEEEKKCYVCFDLFVHHDPVVKLPCHHVFHHACAEDTVAHQHLRCPLCRADIPTRRKENEKHEEDRNSSGHVVRFPG